MTAPEPKGISRRAVTKSIAWSAPVVAAAVAAPAVAASGVRRFRGVISPSGTTRETYTFTLPTDATDIQFVVTGAGGGGTSGPNSEHYAGGAGTVVSGSLASGAAGGSVTMVAGVGGGTAGSATSAAGGDGFGTGGSTQTFATIAGQTEYFARGGAGGGGSALQVGGTTQVIAGGGGGAGGYALAFAAAVTNTIHTSPVGGNGDADGGAPSHTYTQGGSSVLTVNNGGAGTSARGLGAVGATPGAASVALDVTAVTGAGIYQESGTAGEVASLAGANGGTGAGDAWSDVVNGISGTTRVLGQGGGGGGGYAGGGGGGIGILRGPDLGNSGGEDVRDWLAAPCGGGGGGSSYSAGPLVASATSAVASNGGAAATSGGAGSVVIEFNSPTFVANGVLVEV